VTHEPWTARLDAYLDGELESAETLELDRHLRECPDCAAEGLRRMQGKLAIRAAGRRYSADPALRERVQKSISQKRPIRRWWPAYAVTMALLLALAGTAILREGSRQARNNQIFSELVDLHVSTLSSASPVDVVSTDRHTVKPWFAGKIPFTFDLPELGGTPFELVGGRVSYLEQSPGAELLVRVRKHQVTVFIFQERAVPNAFPAAGNLNAQSFHLETFKRNGLRYFVIGDVAKEDLQTLATLLQM
jgi:anti-sigma factor RsiW